MTTSVATVVVEQFIARIMPLSNFLYEKVTHVLQNQAEVKFYNLRIVNDEEHDTPVVKFEYRWTRRLNSVSLDTCFLERLGIIAPSYDSEGQDAQAHQTVEFLTSFSPQEIEAACTYATRMFNDWDRVECELFLTNDLTGEDEPLTEFLMSNTKLTGSDIEVVFRFESLLSYGAVPARSECQLDESQ